MSTDLTKFDGGIPENYDRFLGPLIFVDYGLDLATRVHRSAPESVLELAAGTGIVTRQLRDLLDESCVLTATDLSEDMLASSRAKFDSGERVAFQQADAMQLPFDDASYDVVCCQFGVMFFPDKEASFREVRRVLKPGGRYIFNTWGSLEENPFARVAFGTTEKIFPDDPPGFYKMPFSYHDPEEVVATLQRAELKVSWHQLDVLKAVPSFDDFSQGLVYGNPLAGEVRDRGGVEPEAVRMAIADALREELGSEPTEMPLRARVFEAEKPE